MSAKVCLLVTAACSTHTYTYTCVHSHSQILGAALRWGQSGVHHEVSEDAAVVVHLWVGQVCQSHDLPHCHTE